MTRPAYTHTNHASLLSLYNAVLACTAVHGAPRDYWTAMRMRLLPGLGSIFD